MKSDAENFVPERASQHLQICVDQNKYILPEEENADSLQHWDGEDDYSSDDSLDVLARSHVKKNPYPSQTNVGTEKDGSR